MATVKVNNIHPEMLVWAYKRAGYDDEKAKEAFPLLTEWLSNGKVPTLNQLQKFADKFHVPFGYLFLQQAPTESIPFPMFRGKAGLYNKFDLNVFDVAMDISRRQEWLEDYLLDNDIETCGFVNIISLKTPVNMAVSHLRSILQLEPRWAFSLRNCDVAVNMLTQKLEDAGVFLAYSGIVGNNTHRKLNVENCRGFALVNNIAPYIFVNSSDSKAAQMFTLIHEAAHIMLGISAGHAGEQVPCDNFVEIYCDKVAAEFLVPSNELKQMWNGDIKFIANKFKVSEIVAARRAHDLGLLSDESYRAFWLQYRTRPINKKKSVGGNFYATSVYRVGRLFAIHVRNAVSERQLSYTEAYRLTGLHGNTYQHFMTNNI